MTGLASNEESAAADTVDASRRLTRIGFGSCNNQLKGPQKELFERLSKEELDLWIWGGDVVYAKGKGLDAVKLAYQQLRDDGSYHKFAERVPAIVGTFDDHDLGVNDGGRDTPNLAERQDLFLDFLNVPKDSTRRQRRGLYASHDFGSGNETVRVLVMDTRSGRGPYALSFLGSLGTGTVVGKITPLLAAGFRTLFALTGLVRKFEALGLSNTQMLDEAQWNWLDKQLSSSNASMNILVSSVQVLTHNPTVESWGHFPNERNRLLSLINKAKPKGFLMLSGDVHIGMMSSAVPNSEVVEVTSSGLTHTCTAGGIPHFVCSFVWNVFEDKSRRGSLVLSRNFGKIDIDWESKEFRVSIQSITDDRIVQTTRTFEELPQFRLEDIDGVIPEHDSLFLFSFIFVFSAAMVLLVRLLVYRRLF